MMDVGATYEMIDWMNIKILENNFIDALNKILKIKNFLILGI